MAKTKITEAQIRDHISNHLDLIEPGLTLIDTEFHLPNIQGASGFLDIFARDATGRLVIIEIKRTDAAAREAIQELYKYVPLLRERFLIKDTEIRLILLSVEWRELATPFAEFAGSAPFEVTAGRIETDNSGMPIAISPISPGAASAERRLGVRQFLWGFPDKETADRAVTLLATRIQRQGISDFILVQSRGTKPSLGGRYFIYFAQRELTFDAYVALIERNCSKAQFEEFCEYSASLTELKDRVAEASDWAWSMPLETPYHDIGADSSEISHPEKGYIWLAKGAQEDIIIHRFGRFNDPWLSDQMIIDEIRGEGGESDFRLRLSALSVSPPQMKTLREGVENIFFFNEAWLGAVTQLIRYAERKPGPTRIELIAYSPEDILRAIAGSAFGFPGYVPTFRLNIEHEGAIEQFIGLPEWDGTVPDFDKIFSEHFYGDSFGYFTTCHFGENRSINHDVMTSLGLRYSVFREGEDGPERIRVQGTSIVPVAGKIQSINQMIDEHQEEVGKLVEIFMTTDQGFARTIQDFVYNDHNLAERQLAQMLQTEAAPSSEMYWSGDITSCNLCGQPFESLCFMIDATLPNGGGANICALCFLQEEFEIGTGFGQVYEASAKGWRHIAG